MKSEGLEISQPALDPRRSEIHHKITTRREGLLVHRCVPWSNHGPGFFPPPPPPPLSPSHTERCDTRRSPRKVQDSARCPDSEAPPCTGYLSNLIVDAPLFSGVLLLADGMSAWRRAPCLPSLFSHLLSFCQVGGGDGARLLQVCMALCVASHPGVRLASPKFDFPNQEIYHFGSWVASRISQSVLDKWEFKKYCNRVWGSSTEKDPRVFPLHSSEVSGAEIRMNGKR